MNWQLGRGLIPGVRLKLIVLLLPYITQTLFKYQILDFDYSCVYYTVIYEIIKTDVTSVLPILYTIGNNMIAYLFIIIKYNS